MKVASDLQDLIYLFILKEKELIFPYVHLYNKSSKKTRRFEAAASSSVVKFSSLAS